MRKLLTLLLFSSIMGCYDQDDYFPSEELTAEVFKNLYSSRNTIPADGISQAEITVELPRETVYMSKVKFSTSAGLFENKRDTMYVKAALVQDSMVVKMKATLKLSSTIKLDTATIKCTIGTFEKKIKIIFVSAPADKIKLGLSSLMITTGYDKSVTITSQLSRSKGIVSNGTTANLTVKDGVGNTVGEFLNYSSVANDTGVIVNVFTLGKSNYTGVLTAFVTTGTGDDAHTDSIVFHAN